MFILRNLDSPTIFYLHCGKQYTVGRKNCDFILPGDNTVSKKHANIRVTPTNHVYVEDLQSSNKTYINGNSLNPNEDVELKVGSEVKFGVKTSIFILQQDDEIIVTSSGLKSESRTQLKSVLDQLKGTVMMDWNEKCTHVAVDSIVLTVKVLCALICKQYIVTPNFFQKYLSCTMKNKQLPKETSYVPELEHQLLNVKIDFNIDRKVLFKNKTFVFPNQASQKKTNLLITLAGGIALICDENTISKKKLLNSDTEFIFIQTNENSQNEDTYFNKCIHFLMKNNKRSIPIQEIALAILHCDCTQHCNPSFDKTKHLFGGEKMQVNVEILARESQTQTQAQCSIKSPLVIPETFENLDNAVIENVEVIEIDDNDEDDNENSSNFKRKGEEFENRIVKKTKKNTSSLLSLSQLPGSSKIIPKRKAPNVLTDFFGKADQAERLSSTKKGKQDQTELHTSPQNLEATTSVKRKSDNNDIDISFRSTKSSKTAFGENKTPKSSYFLFKETNNTKKVVDTSNPFNKTVNKEDSPIKHEKSSMVLNPFAIKQKPLKFLADTTSNIKNEIEKTTTLLSSTRLEADNKMLSSRQFSVNTSKTNYVSKWLSKTDISTDSTISNSSIKLEMDEETKLYISGIETVVKVVPQASLIIRRPFGELKQNSEISLDTSAVNFKRFVKVKPLNQQKIIITRDKFKKVICSLKQLSHNRKNQSDSSSESENDMEDQLGLFKTSLAQNSSENKRPLAAITKKKYEFGL